MEHTAAGEAPWARIFVDLEEALIYADREGIIRAWNSPAEKLFGFTAAEALGQSLDIIIPEHLRAAHWHGYDQAIEQGHTAHPGQVRTTRAVHKDGSKRYVAMSFSLITDGEGRALGSAAVARDVTAEHLAARQQG
jgi:PAS domain S-box-containing protein